MLTTIISHLFFLPIIADALITWTPLTYYITTGIVQCLTIVIGFKFLQVDPEYNSFIGAMIAAAIIAAVAFFFKDSGLVGLIITGGTLFGLLVAVSSGDALKSLVVWALCIGVYAGVAHFVIPRTPLDINQIGGIARVIDQGGIEAEPFDENAEKEIYDNTEVIDGEEY